MIDLGLKNKGAKFSSLDASFHLVCKPKQSEYYKHSVPIKATISHSAIFDMSGVSSA